VTNTLPVHRLPFVLGETFEVPAAFVQADDLGVIRIEQRYTLLSSDEQQHVFRYQSATFEFECDLTYDASGLVLDYPGIAIRDR
jgi:hypothetical protein